MEPGKVFQVFKEEVRMRGGRHGEERNKTEAERVIGKNGRRQKWTGGNLCGQAPGGQNQNE